MTPRRPLAPISPNRCPNQQLSDAQRGELSSLALAGKSKPEIEAITGTKQATILKTTNKINKRGTAKKAPRSGRPKTLTPRDERRLIRYLRSNLHAQWKEVKSALDIKISDRHLSRISTVNGIKHWLSKQRPELKANHARIRLQFTHQYRHLTPQDWRQIFIFSDECSVQKGAGKKRSWTFGYPSEKWHKDKIEAYSKGLINGLGLYWQVWCVRTGGYGKG